MKAFHFVDFPTYGDPSLTDCSELRALAAPGQMLSVAFGIRSEDRVTELGFRASTLQGSNVELSVPLDLRIVKTWAQAGVGVYQARSVIVPELLLKDDRVAIADSYGAWCGHWNHILQRGNRYYRTPRLDEAGDARTSLEPRQTKQVWISLRVPESCTAGTYSATITARDGREARELPFRLEILPLALDEAPQDLFLWYKGTLDCRLPQHYVTPSVFEAQLRDIYAHGFRSISLNEPRAELRRRALEIAKRVGFRRNVVLTEPFDETLDTSEYPPLTPVYYVSDELDARGSSAVSHHVANWRAAKKSGSRTMMSLINASSRRRFDATGDVGHATDVASLYLPANLGHFAPSAPSEQKSTYYYWLSHMEKPLVHRVLAGGYLWRSGAAGIAPYCYQHLPQFPNSPFNDFDEWEPGFHVGRERRPFKDHMTTYPANGAGIPTVQWKGLSDGITDLRYLATLDRLMKQAAASPDQAIRDHTTIIRGRVNAFLDRLSLRDIEIVSETQRVPYPAIDSTEYDAFRERIARDAVALSASMAADTVRAGAPA